MSKFVARWYDPPEGWRFGFPKAWPSNLERTDENLKIQLTLDGYPVKDIPLALNHTRFIGEYVDGEETDSD